MNLTNDVVKNKLKKNQVTIGSWITMADPNVAEIMCQAGFEWLVIDMEHSALTLQDVAQHVRVIDLSGVKPLVRVGVNDANLIKRVMDTGAGGVIVPMVNTREEAQAAVDSVYYPPKGKRGVGLARAQEFGAGFEKYRDWLSKKAIVIAQIEHIDGVNNLEEILSVKGIDGIIVGPYDLSGSIGHPGKFDHPKVKNALKRIMKVTKQHKMPAGFHVIPPDAKEIKKKIKDGFSFVAFSLDELFLGQTCSDAMKEIKRSVK